MPTLGYWNLRGLVGTIKLALEEAGVEYTDKVYKLSAPEYSREEWLADKTSLGLDFPNLPYYIDGDVKLTQSLAILRYVAVKHGLAGTSDQDRAHLDMIGSQIADLTLQRQIVCYKNWTDAGKADFEKFLSDHLPAYEKILGDKKFFLGSKVSYADLLMWENLDQTLYIKPDLLDKFSTLKAHYERVKALPKIKAYLESDRFIEFPINGPIAGFGGQMKDRAVRFPENK